MRCARGGGVAGRRRRRTAARRGGREARCAVGARRCDGAFAALAAVAAEGGDGAAADSWDVASEALREDVDAEAAAQAARARRTYAQSDALHREGVERKWGGALKRLRANDESLTELRLSAAPWQPTAAEHAAAMAMTRSRRRRRRRRRAGAHGLQSCRRAPLPQFLRVCGARRRAAAASAQRAIVAQLLEALAESERSFESVELARERPRRHRRRRAGGGDASHRNRPPVQLPVEARAESSQARRRRTRAAHPPAGALAAPRATARV